MLMYIFCFSHIMFSWRSLSKRKNELINKEKLIREHKIINLKKRRKKLSILFQVDRLGLSIHVQFQSSLRLQYNSYLSIQFTFILNADIT